MSALRPCYDANASPTNSAFKAIYAIYEKSEGGHAARLVGFRG